MKCIWCSLVRKLPGNVLKSPTGSALFRRLPLRFSWHGFTAVCLAAKPDVGRQILSYSAEMEDFQTMLKGFLEFDTPITAIECIIDLEVQGHTASSLAAEGGNFNVLDSLLSNGALLNHPLLIAALAQHNHLHRLQQHLAVELHIPASQRLLTPEHLNAIFTRTCVSGHAECAAALRVHMQHVGVIPNGQHNILEAVRAQQHSMIDFHANAQTSLDDDVLGQAVVMSAEMGDHRSMEKLMKMKANPNYGYLSTGDTLQCTAMHCNTLQHTATHCNTLQHTATHCNTLSTGGLWGGYGQ